MRQKDVELEVKILEIDKRALFRELKVMGAKAKGERQIVTYFFDTPERTLQKKKQILRLRQDGGKVLLAFKAPKGAFRQEIEFGVSDFKKAKKFLEVLGFEPTLKTVKKRASFKLDGAEVDIDEYLGELSFIPPFMEVEAENRKILDDYVQKFQKFGRAVHWSTAELIAYYQNKQKESRLHMCFDARKEEI